MTNTLQLKDAADGGLRTTALFGNVTLFPEELCYSVPSSALPASVWMALTESCGVSPYPSVDELRVMASRKDVLASREFRWLEIGSLLEEFAKMGGVEVSFLPNVRCGGTAAQDSQSEANEGRCPPLPPTSC